MKRKIIFITLIFIGSVFLLGGLWWSFFFFPNDYQLLKQEAGQPSPKQVSQKVDLFLLDQLDQAKLQGDFSDERINHLTTYLRWKNYLLKEDSFSTLKRASLVYRCGLGLAGVWIDERSSLIIPNHNKVSFFWRIKKNSVLNFSGISFLGDGDLTLEIFSKGKSVLKKDLALKKYHPPFSDKDIKMTWNNRGFLKAKKGNQWQENEINLEQFANQKILITFSYQSKNPLGTFFLAEPKILYKTKKQRYNVVYLLFDGVTTKNWSFYNENSELTPFLKKVSEKDFIVFDNMISLGDKTRISTSGLFISLLSPRTRHGINRNTIPEEDKEIFYQAVRNGEIASLPYELRKQKYIVEQFGNNGFGVHLSGIGLDYGFSRSYDFSYNPYDTYGVTHSFFNFLRKNKKREFFTYLHYNTPHKPFYAPLANYFKGIIKAPWAGLWRPFFMGCINYSDDVFKNIYLALQNHDLWEKTIVIIATDHGAGYDLSKFDGGFQYNDYTRMTFLIHLPSDLKKEFKVKKKRVKTYVSSLHTAPTIIDLIGAKPVKAFTGRSYSSLLKDTLGPTFFDKYTWCFGRKALSVIRDDYYKYIVTSPDAKRAVTRDYIFTGLAREIPYEQLYNLQIDPDEKQNLIHSQGKILNEFRNYLKQQRVNHPERNILSFFNFQGKEQIIEGKIKTDSEILYLDLYNKNFAKINNSLKKKNYKNNNSFSFRMNEAIEYLVFETKDDRARVEIDLKLNGARLEPKLIKVTPANLSIFNNPIILREDQDFDILKAIKPPGEGGFKVQDQFYLHLSRLDLHRWIDFIYSKKKEGAQMSAGMKETLRSWGYIQ